MPIQRIPIMRYFQLLFCLFFSLSANAVDLQSDTTSDTYTLVVYNVENLFDSDGYAVFDDYKPDVYTPIHVFTKIDNMVRLLSHYNDGRGPDVLVLSEMESDHTQPAEGNHYDVAAFLHRYSHTTLKAMLGEGFNSVIADYPSELLLLKGFYDHGITDYDVAVAYDPLQNGRPVHVQKNVILSRLPIQHDRTKAHTIVDARPILEVWLDVEGYDLAVFANHWKSRASDAEVEKVRVENAKVLKARLDELRTQNPRVDFILGGDFNSDYNQSHRYPYMELTGINDILKSTGNELAVARAESDKIFNLWYEHPLNSRGSDIFRGFWGTLMQIMISPGLYDFHGVQYVDNSFDVKRIPGKNVYAISGSPVRWSSVGNGFGYSDHLPISMNFRVSHENDSGRIIHLSSPNITDDDLWSPIQVTVRMPEEGEYITTTSVHGYLQIPELFDQLFLVEGTLTAPNKIEVNGQIFDLYAPGFNVSTVFRSQTGNVARFYGRLGIFRGNWQFVIESEEFILSPTQG